MGQNPVIFLRGVEKLIDAIAEAAGWIGWLLVLYCMVLGVTDVFLRYVMNQQSLWIGTTMQAAMVLMACVGGAYAIKYDAFVKLDVFYANASRRNRAILDIVTSAISFLFLYVLITKGIDAAQLSLRLGQVTPTAVPIPLYPIKAAIPVGAALVLIMLIRNFVRNVLIVVADHPPEEN